MRGWSSTRSSRIGGGDGWGVDWERDAQRGAGRGSGADGKCAAGQECTLAHADQAEVAGFIEIRGLDAGAVIEDFEEGGAVCVGQRDGDGGGGGMAGDIGEGFLGDAE
ncbi:MAG: hypothetical protein RL328_1619 [Acidobacteriota bacterium]